MNVLKPNQRASVYTLLERNTPGREIARITGIDRKTVRSYRSRWLDELANSPGVATGSAPTPITKAGVVATQIPPHPGHRLLPQSPPVCAKSTGNSLRPNCAFAATPPPSTKTWSTPTALQPPTTPSNAL